MEKTVLIVDDEENITKSIHRLLRKDGYKILTATSGTEALNLLDENEVQVIISDQRMPHMTGSEFLYLARKKFEKSIRIILSGYADFDAVVEAINQGAIYKFVSKPWDDEALREEVRKAFALYKNKQTENPRDPLTGVYDRFYFENALMSYQDYLNRGNLFVFFLDLDYFTKLNEVFGYDMGDLILVGVANRLIKWNKSYDGIISRLENDRFAVLIDSKKISSSFEEIGRDLVDTFSKDLKVGDEDLAITASIGGVIVTKKTHTVSATDIMNQCFEAVRMAKSAGRKQFKSKGEI